MKKNEIDMPDISLAEKEPKTFRKLLMEYWEETSVTYKCPTSLFALDDAINGGWPAGKIVVLAGIPGIGKTTFALCAAVAAAKAGYPVMYFSTEMSAMQVVAIIICHILHAVSPDIDISIQEIKNHLKDDSIRELLCDLSDGILDNLMILDASEWEHTVDEIATLAEKFLPKGKKREGKSPLIIVDFLQQLHSASTTAHYLSQKEILDNAVDSLKITALDYNATVLLLSAIHRDYYDSQSPIPLQALYGSGAIDYAMDLILTMRMHWSSPTFSSVSAMSTNVRDIDMTIVKQKDGPIGQTIRLAFDAKHCAFEELNSGKELPGVSAADASADSRYEDHIDSFLYSNDEMVEVSDSLGSSKRNDDYDPCEDLFFGDVTMKETDL